MADLEVSWTVLKGFITNRNIPINWFDFNGNYFIRAIDGGLTLSVVISQHDPDDLDLQDFESNFKSVGNKVISINHALEATVTEIQTSTTSVQLLPANRDRKGFVLYNDSPYISYISYKETATTNKFTFLLEPRAHYETPGVIFKGVINCVWENDTEGVMRVTEIK